MGGSQYRRDRADEAAAAMLDVFKHCMNSQKDVADMVAELYAWMPDEYSDVTLEEAFIALNKAVRGC